MSIHKVQSAPLDEAGALISAMEADGFEVAHMAATDRGGFGSVVQVVLHFQLRDAPKFGAPAPAVPESAESRLTPKQELFVSTYLANGGNATRAAIAAGYSESRAEVTGSELLKNRKVAEAIQAGRG